MAYLVVGLLLFLGVHSVRIAAEDWRAQAIARVGAHRWRGIYSLLSLLGFGLIVWGFGQARAQPVQLWSPPYALRHLAMLLTLLAFILLAAAYAPPNSLRARFHHPMVLGVKAWAVGHLLSNGNLADVVLFGSFLAWAVLDFVAAQRRDRRAGTVYASGSAKGNVVTVVAGVVAWFVFAYWLHGWLIGVRPLP